MAEKSKTNPKLNYSEMDAIAAKVEEHDMILVRGQGPNQPSLQERVRDMEGTFKEMGFWIRSIALLFLGQFVTVLVTIGYFFIRILPALFRLDSSQISYLVHFLPFK